MSKHTPGPWAIYNPWEVTGPNGKAIACEPVEREDKWTADARLIAAAPDLLAALQWIVDHGDTTDGWRPAHYAMRAHALAAIDKATNTPHG